MMMFCTVLPSAARLDGSSTFGASSSKFAGTEDKLDSTEYVVLSERDILAIVN